MKATVMVVEDKVKPWEMNGSKGETRTLQCVEQNSDVLLIPKFGVKIPLDDKVAGPHKEANLSGAVVELALTDLKQDEHNKRITFTGHCLKVLGGMKFQAVSEAPKAQAQTVQK